MRRDLVCHRLVCSLFFFLLVSIKSRRAGRLCIRVAGRFECQYATESNRIEYPGDGTVVIFSRFRGFSEDTVLRFVDA